MSAPAVLLSSDRGVSQNFEDGVLRDGAPPAQTVLRARDCKIIQTTRSQDSGAPSAASGLCILSRIGQALAHKIK
jgi:hypothetical protein